MSDSLSEAMRRNFRCLAGMMVPASAEFGVPGADDETIFTDIMGCLGSRDLPAVRQALDQLSGLAGGSFADLPPERREAVAEAFHASNTPAMSTLHRVVLQCYYRDDRVVTSLGLEPRPPFPKGHVLEQGDWSLLDPVKRRAKLWRDAPR
jgi:hypothetical protein